MIYFLISIRNLPYLLIYFPILFMIISEYIGIQLQDFCVVPSLLWKVWITTYYFVLKKRNFHLKIIYTISSNGNSHHIKIIKSHQSVDRLFQFMLLFRIFHESISEVVDPLVPREFPASSARCPR